MENPKANEGGDMEPLNEFDQNHFYDHKRLDKNAFGEQNRSEEDLGYQEISGTASLADRLAEEAQLQKKEVNYPKEHPLPNETDGDTLMNVGRAPDS
ncbi:MAG: hypothetical protein REI78_01715 [Pedobacter sp.]|nr:hypothetical protein [Pedobacter sp.]